MAVTRARAAVRVDSSDAEIFRRHYNDLRRFAAVAADSDVDPDDLVMAALIRCLERGPLRSIDDPRSYLRRAIANLALNERRRLSRRNSALRKLGAHRRQGHEDRYPAEETALDAISSADRALLYLVHVDGYSFREAAALLDMSEGSARSRASRARRRLRNELSEEMP